MASKSASVIPGGNISVSLASSRRSPPNEYINMVVAMRVAGRLRASAGNSLARRSSMRRVRALAPTKSCSKHAWKSDCWPTSLKKASRTAGSWSGTSPGPNTSRLFSAVCAVRKQTARKRNAPRVRWKSGMAAHRSRIKSISAGWNGYAARMRSRNSTPSCSACCCSAGVLA